MVPHMDLAPPRGPQQQCHLPPSCTVFPTQPQLLHNWCPCQQCPGGRSCLRNLPPHCQQPPLPLLPCRWLPARVQAHLSSSWVAIAWGQRGGVSWGSFQQLLRGVALNAGYANPLGASLIPGVDCGERGMEQAGYSRWACEGQQVPVPAPCVPHTWWVWAGCGVICLGIPCELVTPPLCQAGTPDFLRKQCFCGAVVLDRTPGFFPPGSLAQLSVWV